MAKSIGQLLTEYNQTDKSLSFTEYVDQQTKGQDDTSLARAVFITGQTYNPKIQALSPQKTYTDIRGEGSGKLVKGASDTKIQQKVLQSIPQEPRRIAANVTDMLVGGTADLAYDVGSFFNISNLKVPDKFKSKVQQSYQTSLGEVFGYDILESQQDDKGNVKYDLERPQTTTGDLAATLTAFYGAFKKGKNPIKELTTPKPKQGRPPKVDTPAYFKKLKKDRRIGALQNLAAAEVAGQIVIDPEEGRFAYNLGKLAGQNDIAVVDTIFEYLDLEDPAELSDMENRLGLLVESLAAGGIIVGGVKALIGTLKGIKAGGSATINQFKNTVNAGRENNKAFKVKEELKPNTVYQPPKLPTFIENSSIGPVTQSTLDFLKRAAVQGFTSKGVMSEQMFSLIKQADNAKVAMSKEALYKVARIESGLRRAAKQISTNPLSSKNQKAYNELNDQFSNYLTGSVKLNQLPTYLRPIAKQVRKDINELSKSLTDTKGAGKYISEELRNEIQKNLNQYLRKTYELFENPQWTPSREAKLDAINYIAKSLRRTKGYRTVKDGATDADRYAEATKRVNDLLKASKGKTSTDIDNSVRTHLNQMFGTKQADKLFANRKNIAPEIRALLGETTAGTTSVFRTLTTLSNYITNVKLYDDLLAAGQGKYFFDDGIKRAGLVKIEGKQFHALNGKLTTPEIAKMFTKQAESKIPGAELYNKLLVLKGFGQASATVLNNITHLRNTFGQSIIMAENGLNPFGKETVESFQVLSNRFKNVENSDEALEELYLKYQRLGIVDQNVRVGEFKQIINEAALGQDQITAMIGRSLTKRGINVVTEGVKKAYKKTEQLYVAEDDLFRIAAFEKELLTLREANTLLTNKLTREQLEKKAAEIIRDTMPTYDLIPDAAKFLRKLPVGNFFAFAAERFRNTYHTYRRGIQEISSGNDVLIERGFERLAAKTTIGLGGSTAVVESSKLLYGVTEEEDTAYRTLLVPEWSKNGSIGYYRNNEGELFYYDLAFTDPDAPVLETLRASYNELIRTDKPLRETDAILYDAVKSGMITFFKPFVEEALLTRAVLDVFNDGRSESGARIPGWDPGETDVFSNLEAAFNYIVNTQIPAGYKNLFPEIEIPGTNIKLGKKDNLSELLYREITDKPQVRRFDGTEKDYNLDLLANTSGFRLYKIDTKSIENAFKFKVRDFNTKREAYQNNLTRGLEYGETYEDVLDLFIKNNTNYYKARAEFNKTIQAAQVFDINITHFTKSIKGTNAEKNAILSGEPYMTPLYFKASQLEDIMDKAVPTQNIPNYKSFQIQLYKIQEQFSALPLLILPEAAQKSNIQTSFPKREQKFKGGLIDPQFPVTDVAENPASRDIANQLSSFEDVANDTNPYKQDMERLGFNKGKEAAIENWYALQQKNKRLNSERNANQYEQSQINRIAKALGIEPSNFDSKNLKIMKRIFSTAESDNRQRTQNKYEQRPGAVQDAMRNLLRNADKNQIDKEWLQSIDLERPETWDDGQADTMMLAYLLDQKGTDKEIAQILQGNFGTNEKGPVRNLYEGFKVEGQDTLSGWVKKPFSEYVKMHPNTNPESNFKRAMDLNL